jgi:hypothetical protein
LFYAHHSWIKSLPINFTTQLFLFSCTLQMFLNLNGITFCWSRTEILSWLLLLILTKQKITEFNGSNLSMKSTADFPPQTRYSMHNILKRDPIELRPKLFYSYSLNMTKISDLLNRFCCLVDSDRTNLFVIIWNGKTLIFR